MIRHYWTLSRKGGTPQEVRRHDYVGQKLEPDVIHAFRTEQELMDSNWLLGIVGGPDRHGPIAEWDVVHADGDGDNEILPPRSHGIEGLFVKAYGELSREDVTAWVERSTQSDDDGLRNAAELMKISIDVGV